jgi:hypothetical protein
MRRGNYSKAQVMSRSVSGLRNGAVLACARERQRRWKLHWLTIASHPSASDSSSLTGTTISSKRHPQKQLSVAPLTC